jgi:hypothetical protein
LDVEIGRHKTELLNCCEATHIPALEMTAFPRFSAGTHFNEMNFGAPPDPALEQRSVLAYKQHVLVGHTDSYNGVTTEDLLLHLAG